MGKISIVDYQLSDSEHNEIFEVIKQRVIGHTTPLEHPQAVILGGQPASGKNFLIKNSLVIFAKKNVVVINGDEYREYHPYKKEILRHDEKQFAFATDPDVREWTKKIFEYSIATRRNIIFEGTMRQHCQIIKTMQRMKDCGYSLIIKALAVHKMG